LIGKDKTKMSLFDKLPLDLTEMIYKMSMKENIDNMSNIVVMFHLNFAKKRMNYRYIKYRNVNRFCAEITRLLSMLRVMKSEKIKTIKELQDFLFWFDVTCHLVIHNTNLIQKSSCFVNSNMIKNAHNKLLYKEPLNFLGATK
jgi:hypothetical protein